MFCEASDTHLYYGQCGESLLVLARHPCRIAHGNPPLEFATFLSPKVSGCPALNEPTFVAQAEHEVFETVMGVNFHDVPEDGLATDGQHGLGDFVGNVADAGALAPAEDYGLHGLNPTHP